MFLISLLRFPLISVFDLPFLQVLFFSMSSASFLYFFLRLACDKNYCSGNPEIIKMWPIFAGTILLILASALVPDFKMDDGEMTENIALILSIISAFLCLGVNLQTWLCFFGDDEGNSCFLCFKPWRYVPESHFNHMMNGQYYQQYPQVYPTQVQHSSPTHVQNSYPTQAQVQDLGQRHEQYPQVYPTQVQDSTVTSPKY